MKRKILTDRLIAVVTGLVLLGMALPIAAQSLFLDNAPPDRMELSSEGMNFLNRLENNPAVATLDLLRIDPVSVQTTLANGGGIELTGPSGTIYWLTPYRITESDAGLRSIYCTTDQGQYIVLTTKGSMVYTEFIDADERYVLNPLSDNLHALVSYYAPDEAIGCDVSADDRSIEEFQGPDHDNMDIEPMLSGAYMDDDNCNARVMIIMSDDAYATLTTVFDVWCQARMDNCNAAFDASNADMHFELAMARRLVMTENPVYHGTVTNKANDLVLIRNGDAPFGSVPVWRNNYRADIVILMVEDNITRPTGGAIYGQAMAVGADDDDAYAICSMPGVNTGRFSFPHEIAHLQGCKHDDDGSSPSWAKAHSTGGSTGIRTIMALGCSSTNQGCRERRYSNPDRDYSGTSTATGSSTRDNARRIDDTEDDVRNWRENWNTVTINPETIPNLMIGNYSANTRITTSGNVIVNSGGILTFRAGNDVNLNNGFEIKNGGEFAVYLQGCAADISRLADDLDEDAPSMDLPGVLEGQILPNPFRNSFVLQLALPANGELSIRIADLTGKVSQVVQESVMAGNQASYRFDTAKLPAGIYQLNVELRSLDGEIHYLSEKMIKAE